MAFNQMPAIVRSDSGRTSVHSWSRQHCNHCGEETLQRSMVCVQCKKGGIPIKHEETRWNGRVIKKAREEDDSF